MQRVQNIQYVHLLNKYLKCSVWRLALRYDIYIYIYIYILLGFKRLNNRYSCVKVTVPLTSSALSVRVLFTSYSAYGYSFHEQLLCSAKNISLLFGEGGCSVLHFLGQVTYKCPMHVP